MKNNIYRRGKSWYVRFRVGKRRHQMSLGCDYEQAKEKAVIVVAEKRGIKEGSPLSDIGWYGFRGKYLGWRKTIKKRATYYFDEHSMDLLQQAFPIRKLEDVTPALLELFQSKLKEQKQSNVAVNRYIRALVKAMKKAEDWDLIRPQKWNRIEKLEEPSGKLRFFSVAECESILSTFKGLWLTIMYLGIRAGLRREEIHTLRWECLSFDPPMIRIEAYDGWVPKDYEARSVPMSEDLLAHLQSISRPQGFVLGDDRPSLERITYLIPKMLRQLGIYNASLHTARHTFGSHLAIEDVADGKIQALMGHADPKTTKIYTHLSPKSIRDSVEKLPAFKLKKLEPI